MWDERELRLRESQPAVAISCAKGQGHKPIPTIYHRNRLVKNGCRLQPSNSKLWLARLWVARKLPKKRQ